MGTGEVVMGADMPLPMVFDGLGRAVLNVREEARARFDMIQLPLDRSSLVSRVAYDRETGLMFVALHGDTRTVYIYEAPHADTFLSFVSATSPGAWYNRYLRGEGVGRYTASDVVTSPRLASPIIRG